MVQPNVHIHHEKLPAGFIRRRKDKPCPFAERVRVELMIRTPEGITSSGNTVAGVHDWALAPSEEGGIVGYRALEKR